MKIFAQAPLGTQEVDLGRIGGDNLGPFGNIDLTSNTAGLIAVAKVVSSVIGVMTIAACIWFVMQFMVGGFFWMTASGDKGHLEQARHRISDAAVGFLVVVAGWATLAIAGQFLGIDTVLSDPASIIKSLGL